MRHTDVNSVLRARFDGAAALVVVGRRRSVVAKNDRCYSQKRAANKEREIGQKQWQQHQGEAAKHRCPILHPLAVSEDDETEGAEQHAPDAIRAEQVRHGPFL